ncbi:MAG: DUF4179 domain-containing protein [Eubacteriales bacterium]|nr:DUF4179 domain-containing protein [Eubacteriales bacterium]
MNERELHFLELFGEIEEDMIFQAGLSREKESSLSRHAAADGRNGLSAKSVRAAACIFFVAALISVGVFQPQVRASIRDFATWFGRLWGWEKDFSPYAEIVDTAQTKEGITVTLKEVILAEDQLYIIVQASDREHRKIKVFPTFYMRVNGEACTADGTSTREAGEGIFGIAYSFEQNTILDEKVNIEMRILAFAATEETLDENLENAVEFEFDFSASREELEKSTLRRELNQRIDLGEGASMTLKSIEINEVFSKIYVDTENLPEFYKEVFLKGEDSLGNEVYYRGDNSSQEEGKSMEVLCTLQNGASVPSTDSKWLRLQAGVFELTEERKERLRMGNRYDTEGNAVPLEEIGYEYAVDEKDHILEEDITLLGEEVIIELN